MGIKKINLCHICKFVNCSNLYFVFEILYYEIRFAMFHIKNAITRLKNSENCLIMSLDGLYIILSNY
jgi:hypothetical protein